MTEEADRDLRFRAAYESFRRGYATHSLGCPDWNKLEPWVRDAIRVAYLQGILDKPDPTCARCKAAAPPEVIAAANALLIYVCEECARKGSVSMDAL